MLINISLSGKITSWGYDRRYQTTEHLSLTIQGAGCGVDLQSTLCEKMKSFENRYTYGLGLLKSSLDESP